MNFASYMMIASNIVALALIGIVLIQGQTSGGLGSAFGGSDIYRTRRGMEKTLYNITFIMAGVYGIFAFITVAFE
ncbi:MAG: preprotein translocase subunit SecG [Litorilinea sp.]